MLKVGSWPAGEGTGQWAPPATSNLVIARLLDSLRIDPPPQGWLLHRTGGGSAHGRSGWPAALARAGNPRSGGTCPLPRSSAYWRQPLTRSPAHSLPRRRLRNRRLGLHRSDRHPRCRQRSCLTTSRRISGTSRRGCRRSQLRHPRIGPAQPRSRPARVPRRCRAGPPCAHPRRQQPRTVRPRSRRFVGLRWAGRDAGRLCCGSAAAARCPTPQNVTGGSHPKGAAPPV